MVGPDFLRDTGGKTLYLVGIKGTGMAALAELLLRRGARVSGSDTTERFYTDGILQELKIPYHEGFDAAHVPAEADLVVHSSAYSPESNPELKRAREMGLPLLTYTEALGAYSGLSPSAGITGVHGKTTTTAMAGTLVKELGLPGAVLAGSALGGFGGRSTWWGGEEFFIAETCEYQRHFLSFHPRWVILTSVELDHPDYFRDYGDILSAFVEYGLRIHPGGALIYCADNPGAREAAEEIGSRRGDLRLIPYGMSARGRFGIRDMRRTRGATRFRLEGFEADMGVRIPGTHSVLNAAAAAALVQTIMEDLGLDPAGASRSESGDLLARGLEAFSGAKRRSEILGEARGILFMDDYAHHPTELKTTLAGLKDFHPHRRLVADFMSHTYSRTAALFSDFAVSFGSADLVVLHRIYASAREKNPGGIGGRDLFEAVRKLRPEAVYFEEPEDAADFLRRELRQGDLFITLGAGDNWRLGEMLYREFQGAGP